MNRAREPEQSLSRQDLYTVAIYQKVILLCILCYLGAVVAQFAVPEEFRLFLILGVVAVGIAATVFVFMLAIKLYETGTGVVLGILTLVPLVGLIILLVVNSKATGILQQHGYQVGLLGANLSQFRD
jgi:hypothetical protein